MIAILYILTALGIIAVGELAYIALIIRKGFKEIQEVEEVEEVGPDPFNLNPGCSPYYYSGGTGGAIDGVSHCTNDYIPVDMEKVDPTVTITDAPGTYTETKEDTIETNDSLEKLKNIKNQEKI